MTGVMDVKLVPVYDESEWHSETGQVVGDVFQFVSKDYYNISLDETIPMPVNFGVSNVYLTQDGQLHEELVNIYDRWKSFDTKEFCMGYSFPFANEEETLQPSYFVNNDNFNELATDFYEFNHLGMMVTCGFLLITFIIYTVIPQLKTLDGLLFRCFIFNLFCGYALIATLTVLIQYLYHTSDVCCGFTYSIYFFFIAALSWMNVMSFDNWSVFKGPREVQRSRISKFLIYSLFGWGVPLMMSVVFIVVNISDLSHLPWIITPNVPRLGCFIGGGEKFVYLTVPMLLLNGFNWMWIILAAHTRRLNMRHSLLRGSAPINSPHDRMATNIKLSLLMSISWLSEAGSFLWPNVMGLWFIFDLFTSLIGIAIFITYVFKSEILKKYYCKKGDAALINDS